MAQVSLKSADFVEYDQLDLHELEALLKEAQNTPPSEKGKNVTRVLRQAMQQRLRQIKARAMDFEQTNDRYLLMFDSTEGFAKMAGRSVLYFSLAIANRIGRRVNVHNDTDNYSPSADGIIAVRDMAALAQRLAEINIFPDKEKSTTELHFYKMTKVYTDEQVEKLRDHTTREIHKITTTILPQSPHPALYMAILELNQLVYHNCKRISDVFVRDVLAKPIMAETDELLIGYLNFANAKDKNGVIHAHTRALLETTDTPMPETMPDKNLLGMLLTVRNIRNRMANVANLQLIHNRKICEILDLLIKVERAMVREYNKRAQQKMTLPRVPRKAVGKN